MTKAVGEAPGKILLIGEHAAVYGHPAIAIPMRGVQARVEVELTRNGTIDLQAPDIGERGATSLDAPRPATGTKLATAPAENASSRRIAPFLRLASYVMEFFGEQKQGLRITIHSTIPVGRGMGSGAAVSVALVRAICNLLGRKLAPDQVSELAMEAERLFHGNPSGVDCAVVSRDEPIYFIRGREPQPITIGASVFHFVVADTGIVSPTINVVEDVRAAREQDKARYDSYFWELGSMASVAREVLRGGTPAELGVCMNHAHSILQEVDVSCPELDQLVSAALEKGAIGAKLSGAGRGGIMIALVENESDAERLAGELLAAGAEKTYTTALG